MAEKGSEVDTVKHPRRRASSKKQDEWILGKQAEQLRLDPSNPSLWFQRAILLGRIGHYGAAARCFERVAKLNPRFPGLYTAMGHALQRIGNRHGAARAYGRAFESLMQKVQPDYSTAVTEKSVDAAISEIKKDLLRSEIRRLRDEMTSWSQRGYDVSPLAAAIDRDPEEAYRMSESWADAIRSLEAIKQFLPSLQEHEVYSEVQHLRELLAHPDRLKETEAIYDALRKAPSSPPIAPVEEITMESRTAVGEARAGVRKGADGRGAGFGIVTVTRRKRRWHVVAIPLVVLIMVLAPLLYFIWPVGPRGGVVVDGNAVDWAGMPLYEDRVPSSGSGLGLVSYRIKYQGGYLSFLVEASRKLFMEEQEKDYAFVLVDADGRPETGYQAYQIGADHLLMIEGSSGSISSASLQAFQGSDPRNWSAWRYMDRIDAAFKGDTLELQVGVGALSSFQETGFRVLVGLADDLGGVAVASVPVTSTAGSLLVTQRRLTEVLPSNESDILEIDFTAYGREVAVTDLDFAGTLPPKNLTKSFSLVPGQHVVQRVRVNASTEGPGTIVGIGVERVETTAAVRIVGGPARAYVDRIPPMKRVDGIFDDWSGEIYPGYEYYASRPSIDIRGYAVNVTSDRLHFFLEVRGDLFSGSVIPVGGDEIPRVPPEPGMVAQRHTGEDALLVYIDTDAADAIGPYVNGIFSDIALEVRGQYGAITSALLYRWDSDAVAWDLIDRGDVAKDGNKIEGSINIVAFRSSQFLATFYLVGWDGSADKTLPISVSTVLPAS